MSSQAYFLKPQIPNRGLYFGRCWEYQEADRVGGSGSCPLGSILTSYSCGIQHASWLPGDEQCCFVTSFRGCQLHFWFKEMKSKDHGLKHLKSWTKTNASNLKYFSGAFGYNKLTKQFLDQCLCLINSVSLQVCVTLTPQTAGLAFFSGKLQYLEFLR